MAKRKPVNLYLDVELVERYKKALSADSLGGSLSEFVEHQLRANLLMVEAASQIDEKTNQEQLETAFGASMLQVLAQLGESVRIAQEEASKEVSASK